MPADANAVLQASVTKVDTFNSTGVDLGAGALYGNSPRELVARVLYSAATEASGGKTVIFSVQQCDTVGGTYNALASGAKDTITLSTTAQAGEIFIPFLATQEFVRLVMTLSANTNSPSITYQGDIVPSRP
jgi:hypothetical protein